MWWQRLADGSDGAMSGIPKEWKDWYPMEHTFKDKYINVKKKFLTHINEHDKSKIYSEIITVFWD